MKFIDISKDNLLLATKIQMQIFSEEDCAYLHYLYSFINPEAKKYFMVYENREIIGITGIYEDEFTQEADTVWVGWYGVLPKYRGQGYGERILMETIELAAKSGYKFIRLYTESANVPACRLYDKVMYFKETYCKENIPDILVYSKSLCSETCPKFDNKYLGLNLHLKEQEEGYKMYMEASGKNNS